MARLKRILIPNVPHHVTQRGNRRMQTFFEADDYEFYLKLLFQSCKTYSVKVEAFCLMPNHVHLILTPSDALGIRHVMSEVHSTYSRRLNFIRGWKGMLWQGRFFSCPMDSEYFANALRYVLENPIRAGLCIDENYRWSGSFVSNIAEVGVSYERNIEKLRHHTRTGRAVGSCDFLERDDIKNALKRQ